ncbi:hypothetical protein MAM1_0071c04156 [Mucor ambiguus]|uniref:BTB domain-containing protein n=1 Tax=Mucor ambiguus TaxID=91626 RepID=A0A0C9MND3_9FUNG|nr:hypothetical protein MAM1_0071c04156 [Mucor ambiguus]
MTTSDLSQAIVNNETPNFEPESTIVKLNVGGRSFSTFKSTLVKSKYFENLLNEDVMASKALVNTDEIFIDRSGNLFRDILYYLRTGTVTANNSKRLTSLQKEAEFYQMQELENLIVRSKKQATQEANRNNNIIVYDLDILGASNDYITNYIVRKSFGSKDDVYQLLGIIDVLISYYCQSHRKHGCTECFKKKLILRPCNKRLV